jgi:16S rRNA (guanine527-N7)-methyltransferase
MTKDRIAELLAPFLESPLSDPQLRAVKLYLDLLLKWNSKINLTSIHDPDEIVTRHFGESFLAAQRLYAPGDSGQSAIDLGSGAGFPGIPLKLWVPGLEVTLIESNQRKATFLREVVRALNLGAINVLAARAESVALHADIVTFRAVEHFERILRIARSLVKPAGRLAILIGATQAVIAQFSLPEVNWETPVSIPLSRSRTVLIGHV